MPTIFITLNFSLRKIVDKRTTIITYVTDNAEVNPGSSLDKARVNNREPTENKMPTRLPIGTACGVREKLFCDRNNAGVAMRNILTEIRNCN